MDISTSCAVCIHKSVCFARKQLNALNQTIHEESLIFSCRKEYENADEKMESVLAYHCQSFKRKKSEYA